MLQLIRRAGHGALSELFMTKLSINFDKNYYLSRRSISNVLFVNSFTNSKSNGGQVRWGFVNPTTTTGKSMLRRDSM